MIRNDVMSQQINSVTCRLRLSETKNVVLHIKCSGVIYRMAKGQGHSEKDTLIAEREEFTQMCRWVDSLYTYIYGDIQVLRNAVWGGGVKFPGEKRYEGVRLNVISTCISVTRG